MAELLLDTRAVLLWTTRWSGLGERARQALEDPRTRPAVSAAPVWAMAIKERAGKLPLPEGYFDRLFATDLRFLPMTERHAVAAGRLPRHHADRMLIAQA